MGFAQSVKDEVLVKSARHCSVCRRYRGLKIEIHHIVPKAQGGKDTIENAIALCFDCHCDAGHYNSTHPKGSMFSPRELRKHRDEWEQIVITNSIPVKIENLIHARFVITKDFSMIREILNRDLSNFPVKDTLLLENKTLNLASKLIRSDEMRWILIKNVLDISIDEYIRKYPWAKQTKAEFDGYVHHYIQRKAEESDIERHCGIDPISTYLLRSGIDAGKIAEIHTSMEGECGINREPRLAEFFNLRPFYFKSLLITNISSRYIKLKELFLKQMTGTLYTEDQFNEESSILLPNVFISPNQSVLIPTGSFLSAFEDFKFTPNFSETLETDSQHYQTIAHGKMETSKQIEFIGENILPMGIEIEVDQSVSRNEIHKFDFESIYWIDRHMGYGSCPHLFFKNSKGKLSYQREILDVSPNTEHTELVLIPPNIIAVVVAELEQEITYINSIKLNNQVIKKSITLKEGESIEFDVKENDSLIIQGYYITNSNQYERMPTLKKLKIITEFIKDYGNKAHAV